MQDTLSRGDVHSSLRMPRSYDNLGLTLEHRQNMERQEGKMRQQLTNLRRTGIRNEFQWSNILTPLFWLSLPVLRETRLEPLMREFE
eukprot:14138425-Alexandrium_andersonii.AAC.1